MSHDYNDYFKSQQKIQQEHIDEQDEILEDISHEIHKLKQVTVIIGDEVDEQNLLLDDTNNEINSTNINLKNTNNKLDRITNMVKDKYTCFIIILIIILILMIIIYFS